MYTKQDAEWEISTTIDKVIMSRDIEGAYALANIFAEQDDSESAEHFRRMARAWNREDNYHDEHNDN